MPNNHKSARGKDLSGVVMGCLFILLAVILLWDTTKMLDSDSFVFPRAIAVAMILLSLILIVTNLIHPTQKAEPPSDTSTIRRTLLVIAMLVSCLLMPWLGFLISGFSTFILLMLISMYDKWTPKKKLLYPLIAISVVAGFYALFSNLLQVPLPVGVLFG